MSVFSPSFRVAADSPSGISLPLRRIGAALACAWLGLCAAQAAPFDFTFITTGDSHLKAFDTTTSGAQTFNPKVRANLTRMKALPGTAFPSPYNNLTVGTPLGLIVAGDLVDGGSETDPATGISYTPYQAMVKAWDNFEAAFGLTGTEVGARINFPVYETYGNHDQNGFWKTSPSVENILDNLAGRNVSRPNVTSISGTFQYTGGAYSNATATGAFCAWKWGPFHFVNTGVRVGDSQSRYPSAGTFTFLQNYLQNVVGNSGEPVFVIHHLPPSSPEGDWPVADQRAYYNLVKDYNIAGLIVAHTHSFGDYTWQGPDTGSKVIRVYQADSCNHSGTTQGYGTVFRIFNDPNDSTKATMIAAQRLINGTWGTTVQRSITIPSGTTQTALTVTGWKSLNSHAGTDRALTVADDNFVEPRAGGVRKVEVTFSEAITVGNPSQAVTITGVNSSGAVTLAGLGITASVAVASDKLTVTFSNGGGACALPDAAKWRFTLNTNAIAAVSTASFTASADTTRVISGLLGDVNASGRVSGLDLSQIDTTPAFDSANAGCLRADIDGSGAIDTTDRSAAWANRVQILENLANP